MDSFCITVKEYTLARIERIERTVFTSWDVLVLDQLGVDYLYGDMDLWYGDTEL